MSIVRAVAGLVAALMLLLSAVPAPAACHGGAAGLPMAMRHHTPARPAVPTDHVCIGCALVADWLNPPLAPRRAMGAPAMLAAPPTVRLGGRYPPDPRPPRSLDAMRA